MGGRPHVEVRLPDVRPSAFRLTREECAAVADALFRIAHKVPAGRDVDTLIAKLSDAATDTRKRSVFHAGARLALMHALDELAGPDPLAGELAILQIAIERAITE